MTWLGSLLLCVVLAARLCEGSFSILSEPRESCAAYQGIADAADELTVKVEAAITTFDPLLGLKTKLQELLSSLTVHPSCSAITGSSGLYRILEGNSVPVHYFCEMSFAGGGWTMMQRRSSASTNFTRSFAEYRDGFGHPSGDFWLGLNRLHLITQASQVELAIIMEAYDGTSATVRYTNFKVSDLANNFRLTTLSGFTGAAGNSMSTSVGMTFSTFDKDTDTNALTNCANVWGGGWWMSNCGDSNLNGYYRGPAQTSLPKTSMVWTGFKGVTQPLKKSIMLIRKYVP
ncbi:microfibril-associated glycoprotein 4-like [Anopheles ziemanni]|uniref:microfibril-associated glycoprotein 4-like n=1 Tax=Anopheles coustani TaxID=139045 RepID=UPI002657F6A5|nr:microfibril-associated glycoprotein 4-like [Anopheles coustani]XP_058178594.1 microfibril-associated glycoprotein 4-like [Anopheles ziemanni]